MSHRYRMRIEYLGTDFCGWQAQPNTLSVQEVVEKALGVFLREKVVLFASGRTDSGVHAQGQVAHFDTQRSIDNIFKALNSVNSLTPRSVVILSLDECSLTFHSRYDAIQRDYEYTLAIVLTALNAPIVWQVYVPLNFQLFQNELKKILGNHDFHLFSIPREDSYSTICEITKADLKMQAGCYKVYISGNRFLHKMVRSIVGVCYDVARGRHKPGLMNAIFKGESNIQHTWAPAQGLLLKNVVYPSC